MELSRKYKSACPKDLINKTFIVSYIGLCTVKGADSNGILVISDQHQLFTFKEAHVREYLLNPTAVHKLIK
jgi:hypothetical protein